MDIQPVDSFAEILTQEQETLQRLVPKGTCKLPNRLQRWGCVASVHLGFCSSAPTLHPKEDWASLTTLHTQPKQMGDLHSCIVISRGRSAPDRLGCTYSNQWAAFSWVRPRWGRSGWNTSLPFALSSSVPDPVLQTRRWGWNKQRGSMILKGTASPQRQPASTWPCQYSSGLYVSKDSKGSVLNKEN